LGPKSDISGARTTPLLAKANGTCGDVYTNVC
jgi:hypothetical protein